MKREIENYFLEWKISPNRKPLIVRGARQVGKTFSIRKFAKEHFQNFFELNLEQNPHIGKVFASLNPQRIMEELSALYGVPIKSGETLLFIDEIQAYPQAIVALRYFYEQHKDIYVIAAGSLLDHTLNDKNFSMPVGRIEFANMYPMTFIEFLNALGEVRLTEYINNYSITQIFSEIIHDRLLELLRLYFFIGGMPEAVHYYVENRELSGITKIHASLSTSLELDFSKYGTRKQQENLRNVLHYVVNNIGHKVKYSNINKEAHSLMLKDAFYKLEMSRIIHLVRHTSSIKIPLTLMQAPEVFKPVFFDIGIMNHFAGIHLSDINNLITAHEGMLAEQFVLQELIATNKPYVDSKLFYWLREAKNSNAEIDCMLQIGNKIYPVEVKAGKGGTLKSLHVFMAEKNIKTGIRFNCEMPSVGKNLKAKINLKDGELLNYNLVSLPLYLAGRVRTLIQESDFS